LFAGDGFENSSVALSWRKAAKAGLAPCLIACTDDRTMASLSLLKASARLRRVASEFSPNAALMDDATEVEACSSFSLSLSSSASVMGAACVEHIRSRNGSHEARGLSCGRIDDVEATRHRVDVFMKTASSSTSFFTLSQCLDAVEDLVEKLRI
jgi:hypothetical protein